MQYSTVLPSYLSSEVGHDFAVLIITFMFFVLQDEKYEPTGQTPPLKKGVPLMATPYLYQFIIQISNP